MLASGSLAGDGVVRAHQNLHLLLKGLHLSLGHSELSRLGSGPEGFSGSASLFCSAPEGFRAQQTVEDILAEVPAGERSQRFTDE